MKTILATAYAINPLKGSEDGMGWNFVLQIARFNRVIAVTRENNRLHIELYMQQHPDERYANMQFLYYDTPKWMRFWKKGGRGAMLYYLLWQRTVVPFIARSGVQFDVVHNLNFHNDWSPTYLWKLGKPFVWGPIGHHPLIPAEYLKPYSFKYYLKDRLTWLVKKMFWNLSPALRQSVKHADIVWAMNPSVQEVLDLKGKKMHVSPSVATEDFGWDEDASAQDSFTVLSAGRLVPLKGFDMTIRSFARFLDRIDANKRSGIKLVIVGSGPEEAFLKGLVTELGVGYHVEFISWIDRADVMNLFRSASAFLFPSHEGAGMVVPEALSFGVPVVALDNVGPGLFLNSECGFAVEQGAGDETVGRLADALHKLYGNPAIWQKMRRAARAHFENYFHWDRRGERLRLLYASIR
jgi:glycosyltransferase involved in cell wall biosynthesis